MRQSRDDLRTLVVDDEPLARRNLTVLLGQDREIGAVRECGSGAEAVEAIRRWKPDLVFLDVQMPQVDGFDVLEQLGGDLPAAIIFVTAHDDHAVRAFEVGALDYLVKPFDDARFHRALARAKEKVVRDPAGGAAERRLVVKHRGRVRFVEVASVDWIEAADYYACLHAGTDAYIIRRSISDLERQLEPLGFARIHRSTLVNLDRLQGLAVRDFGELAVTLKSGAQLRLSRRYRKALRDRLATGSL